MPTFNRITIIGLGLIGGSLGMAVRKKRLAREVVGFSRKPSTLIEAKRKGAIDRGETNLRAAVSGADMVVLATPVDLIVPLAKQAARFMKPGSVITDVGSTKAEIVAALDNRLPASIAFVGGHPIAGSEQRGIDAACANLFDGSLCILTPTRQTPAKAIKQVSALWKPLVAQLITMGAKKHDQLLGATSHLPHLLAFCLAGVIDASCLPQAPRSFLEMTRLAKSDPDLWDDILLSNREELVQLMDLFSKQWRAVRETLTGNDHRVLRNILSRAKAQRDALDRP